MKTCVWLFIITIVMSGLSGCSSSSGSSSDPDVGVSLDVDDPSGLASKDVVAYDTSPGPLDILSFDGSDTPSIEPDSASDVSDFVSAPDGLVLDLESPGDSLADTSAPPDGSAFDTAAPSDGGADPDAFVDSSSPGPVGSSGWCLGVTPSPWSRKIQHAGGTVTLNEIFYHPLVDDQAEWVELYNPMTIDMDISFWRLDGGISFVFPDGTFLKAGSYLVVSSAPSEMVLPPGVTAALGPFSGKLSNGGEKIELWNNFGRLMDLVSYGDVEPWGVTADGSGVSLAKVDPISSSEPAEHWTHSGVVGGTPGVENFVTPSSASSFDAVVTLDSTWAYQASGSFPGVDWVSPAYDDNSWPIGTAVFWSGAPPVSQGSGTALFTADNFFALYVGDSSGQQLQFVGRDSVGDWTSAESFSLPLTPSSHLYVAAWEAPGSNGGPQMLIGQVLLPDGTVVPTDVSHFDVVVGPPNASPGGNLADPSPTTALLSGMITSANTQQTWGTPKAQATKGSSPWGGALSGVFLDSVHYIWPDTFDALSVTNQQNTFALFRSKEPILPSPGETELPKGPVTVYFRTHFQVNATSTNVQLWLDTLIDDGAVFYLNGVEVYRQNMPQGPVTPATYALSSVGTAVPADGISLPTQALVSGDNVLAVELHDALDTEADRTFGVELFVANLGDSGISATPPLQIHEISAGGVSPFWVELKNTSALPITLDTWVLVHSNGATYPLPSEVLSPGELWVLDGEELGFTAVVDDMLFLKTLDGTQVLDGVRVMAHPRARSEVAPGPWFYPDTTTPGAPNVLNMVPTVVLNEIHYHDAPTLGDDGALISSGLEWIELFNYGATPVNLAGWTLNDGIEFVFPDGTVVPPAGYLVVTNDSVAFTSKYPSVPTALEFDGGLDNGGERIVLRDGCGNPVDEVTYQDSGRWPTGTDGGGASLELKDPLADNGAAEAWGPSDESTKTQWVNISYEGVAQPSAVGPDSAWKEFVLGLMDAGVVLIDDLSVVEDPNGAKIELLQNGAFSNGTADKWRIVGTHRHSEVVGDPDDPQNPVLRLVATGATEHMHNHAETTLANGKSISNGKTYRISYRARWVSGSNQLNTRLYFNRLAKTTWIPRSQAAGTPGALNSQTKDNLGPTYSGLVHDAAVPKPSEPVMVRVTADDPDGVSALTLWTSVNGAPFVATPMETMGNDGVFAALVPGQAAGTLVQFYVEGVDTLGAQSWFPQGGPLSRAMWKVDDGFAATNGLHNVRIVMSAADSDWMHKTINLMSNDPIECTVIVDERKIHYGATVRTKGSQRGRPEVKRLGFALRFPKDNRFRGIYRSVFVDRSEGVGYGQREMLMNQMMNRAGSVSGEYNDLVQIITPRPEHTGAAELQLSRFSDLMLDFQFEDGGDGMLYEYELVYYPVTTNTGTPEGFKVPAPDNVVGVPIVGLGTGFGEEKERYRYTYTLKNNRDRDAYGRIIEFAKTFGQSGWAFQEQIEGVLDIDQWLRTFAFVKLSGCVDNYGSDGAQHNAQFYVRPEDQRVLFFPHDLDFYPGSPTSGVIGAGDLGKLVWSQTHMRTYYGHLYDIIQSAYNDSYMAYWRDHFGKLLPGQNFVGHHQFLVARSNHVLSGAADSVLKAYPQVGFEITTNGGQDLTVATQWVTLEGQGWIDVRDVFRVGEEAPLEIVWWNKTGWQVDVVVECGKNEITLEARNIKGVTVGADSIIVIREGAGCP